MNRRTFIKGIVAGISALVVGEGLAAKPRPKYMPLPPDVKWFHFDKIPELVGVEGIEWVKCKSNVWQFRYAGLIFFAYPCSVRIAMALHIPDDKPDYNYAATQLIQKETFWKKETREEICRLLIRDIEIKTGVRRVFNTGSGYQYVT